MTGTVLGEWIESAQQSKLLTISGSAARVWNSETRESKNSEQPSFYAHCDRPLSECKLYGMTSYCVENKVALDGGCGFESMREVAHAIGLEIESVYSGNHRNSKRIGFIVSNKGE